MLAAREAQAHCQREVDTAQDPSAEALDSLGPLRRACTNVENAFVANLKALNTAGARRRLVGD